ncbi:MAG: glycosyl transferase, family 51 [Frankiales bacterium]|nr:glycosyl transferase, family 51 [Frankiales bacterium]
MRNPPALVRIAFALVLCVIAGVCVAGLTFPLIGGLGLASKSAADQLKPEKPPALVLPQATKILARDGHTVLATLFTENRVAVKLSQVPQVAQDALIAIEDSRFYEHHGIDVKGTLRAVLHNSSSGSTQGGSTLTQQYVKNLLIETADTAAGQKAAVQRSVKRKLQEARYALYLEQHMTKQQILEGYLNIAYYGSGVYGIGTAAQHYFGRRAALLTVGQAAMLAGMVQNPNSYDPSNHLKASITRRNVVLDRMVALGYLTATQRAKAISEPVGLVRTPNSQSGCEAAQTAPFFCDYLLRYLWYSPAGAFLGSTKQERQQQLLSGGLTITTTLDPVVQAAADKAVRDKVPPDDPSGVLAVADTVEPGTGQIKAMAVNRDYGTGKGQTKVNFAIGGSRGFQGGSTFKAFVLARALQMGISPSLTLYAPQRYCPKAFPYPTPSGCGPSNAGDSESGTFDMVTATWASVNTWFIQLEERTGVDAPVALAESLGVRDVDGTFAGDHIQHVPAFVFGAAGPHGYSPLAMAGAYATFAAHGMYCPPDPILSITDSRGVKQLEPQPDPQSCKQVLEPAVADKVTSILRGVVDGPLAARTGAGASIGRPVAGKTGTTNEEKAAWFIGYTPQLATAVWMGKSTPTSMASISINGAPRRAIFGGTVAAPIFAELMSAALQGVAVAPMPPLLGSGGTGPLTPVPNVVGLRTADAEVQLRTAGFQVKVAPAVNAAPVPAGVIATVSPAGQAPAGSVITIVPSNGLAPVVTASPTATQNPPPTGKPKPTHQPKPSASAAPSKTP